MASYRTSSQNRSQSRSQSQMKSRAKKRKSSKHSFCAFCRTPRVIYTQKHISAGDAFLCFLTATLLAVILFQDFDPRIVVFFAIGLGLSELFVLFRWRLSIVCPHCGFDPVLYKKAPEKAAERVKRYLDLRRADPSMALAPMPKLPTLIKQADRNAPSTGAMR